MRYLFGDCELDVARRNLTRNGESVAIEPQVFDLLVLLLGGRERVVTKGEIFEEIWDGRAVADGILTTRMRSLRRAIDPKDGPSYIRTLQRVGYCFDSPVSVIEDQTKIVGVPPDMPVQADARLVAAARPAQTPAKKDKGRSGKPSIAILPLDNMSSDPEQDYFSDGITEDIITELSKFPELSVMARNSSFAFRGQGLPIKEISNRLGARYIVEGSVRRSANRARITVQLIDADVDSHVWAERYDREIEDIFAVQDEVTRAIVTALVPNVGKNERERALRKLPENLDAWENYHRGMAHFYAFNDEKLDIAMGFLEKAIDLDPTFADAHAGLSYICSVAGIIWDPGPELDAICDRARKLAKRAVDLDDQAPLGWVAFARSRLLTGNHKEAVSAARLAIELNPNFALGHYILGQSSWHFGQPQEAVQSLDKALELSPLDWLNGPAMGGKACALAMLGRYEDAIFWSSKAQLEDPGGNLSFLGEICALGHLEQKELAAIAIGRANCAVENSTHENSVTLNYVDRAVPIAESAAKVHFFDGLRKAGVPDGLSILDPDNYVVIGSAVYDSKS